MWTISLSREATWSSVYTLTENKPLSIILVSCKLQTLSHPPPQKDAHPKLFHPVAGADPVTPSLIVGLPSKYVICNTPALLICG